VITTTEVRPAGQVWPISGPVGVVCVCQSSARLILQDEAPPCLPAAQQVRDDESVSSNNNVKQGRCHLSFIHNNEQSSLICMHSSHLFRE